MKLGLLWIAASLCAAQAGTVEGLAYNKITRAGVAGVTVQLWTSPDHKNTPYNARTDAAGMFRIENVAAGAYIAWFQTIPGMGFAPGLWNAKPFTVADGSGTVRIEAPIVPPGKLAGRVLDPDGRPIRNIRVEIFRVYGASGHTLVTDRDGRYQATGMVPGAYRVRARPVFAGIPGMGAGLPPAGEGQVWAPTYYPNSVELSGSQSIFVKEGAELDGFDIRLRTAPAWRLRGLVLDDDGKPAPGATVRLHSEIGWGTAEAQVKSGSDGRFEFPAVRSGEWKFSAEAKRDDVTLKGYAALTMPKRDLEGVTFRLNAPFDLDGAVEGLPRAGRPAVTAMFYPLEDDNRAGVAIERSDGSLYFETVYPGRYRADVWSHLPGYYLRTVLLGPRDITGLDFDLAPDSPDVRFVFAPNAARVRGEVEDGAGVKVVLVEADPNVYLLGQSIRVAVADPDGKFTVEALRPGPWYAFAFATHDNMNTDAIRDAVFRRGLAQQTAPIRLQEGESATLKLKISPWPE